MDKRGTRSSVMFWIICALGCFCLYTFISALVHDLGAGELAPFEIEFRIAGYVLALGVMALSAVWARGKGGRIALAAIWLSFIAVVLLDVHDVLMYRAYGNALEGAYTMTAFFAMDIALTVLYPVLILLYTKRRACTATFTVAAAIIVVFALYILGDLLGYPVKQPYDWDESLMELAHTLPMFLLLLSDVGTRERGKA